MGVRYYLEGRLDGHPVWTVCERCKALAMPLAEPFIEAKAQDHEDEGRFGEAEDCRDLLKRLARETGLARGTG